MEGNTEKLNREVSWEAGIREGGALRTQGGEAQLACAFLLAVGAAQVALMVKNPPAKAGDVGSISGLGRSPGGGHGNTLQRSCLENPVDRGAWRAAVRGAAQVPTGPKRLSARAAAEHRASASPAPAAPQQSRSTWPCCGLAFPAARAAGVDGYAGKERLGRVCG